MKYLIVPFTAILMAVTLAPYGTSLLGCDYMTEARQIVLSKDHSLSADESYCPKLYKQLHTKNLHILITLICLFLQM